MNRQSTAFLRGFGSVLDLFPRQRTVQRPFDDRTDREKIAGDWKKIGGDFDRVIAHDQPTEEEKTEPSR